MTKLKKILKWVGIVVVAAYLVLVVVRVIMMFDEDKTKVAVEKIHNTKLTMSDVLGTKLPPEPGAEAAMATVQGIDANENGIRDDVELAIFKEYPNSAKTRAVLLQYALALQLEMTQEVVNTETVTAVAEQTSRGYLCIGKILSRDDLEKYIKEGDDLRKFVESRHLDTDPRKIAQKNFYNDLRSGDVPNENICDVDVASLSI